MKSFSLLFVLLVVSWCITGISDCGHVERRNWQAQLKNKWSDKTHA